MPVSSVCAHPEVCTLSLQPADLSLSESRSPVWISVRDDASLRALAVLKGSAKGFNLLLQTFHSIWLTLAVDHRLILNVSGP